MSSVLLSTVETGAFLIVQETEQGPPGPPGSSGSGAALVQAFSWGDASPAIITTVLANKTVFKVEIIILVGFDTLSTITVGDSTNTSRLLDASSVDAQNLGTYQTNPDFKYLANTAVNIYITPGIGNTVGNGLILIYIQG
jgi:hypothetical protein